MGSDGNYLGQRGEQFMSDTVLSRVANNVCTITLNRPERLNAINGPLIADLHTALTDAHADPEARVIVLRGAGRAFCAGDDLIDFPRYATSEAVARAYVEDLQEITRLIVFEEKLVIGAVHGWAAGGGFEWLIDCDIVLMAQDTRCFFPESGLGLVVTGAATVLLPRIVGLQRARAMIVLGEKIDADEALQMGLAWRVFPEAVLFDEAQAIGERIASLPERGVHDAKRLLNRDEQMSIEEALQAEVDAVVPGFVDPVSNALVGQFKS